MGVGYGLVNWVTLKLYGRHWRTKYKMPGNPRKVGSSLGNQSNKIGVLPGSFRNDCLRYEPIEA